MGQDAGWGLAANARVCNARGMGTSTGDRRRTRTVLEWVSQEHPGHDGLVVGLVQQDGGEDAGLYRELQYPIDVTVRRVELVAAGCECGWRSPRWSPRVPTEWRPWTQWGPWSVFAPAEDDERALALWRRHVALDVGGDRRSGAGELAGPADPESRRS